LSTRVAVWRRKDHICHVKSDTNDRKMKKKESRKKNEHNMAYCQLLNKWKDSPGNISLDVYFTTYTQKRHYISISICFFDFIRKKVYKNIYCFRSKRQHYFTYNLRTTMWDRSLIALLRHRQRQEMQQCRRNIDQAYVKTNLFVWLIQLGKLWNDRPFCYQNEKRKVFFQHLNPSHCYRDRVFLVVVVI
jgi:hypothetical protein